MTMFWRKKKKPKQYPPHITGYRESQQYDRDHAPATRGQIRQVVCRLDQIEEQVERIREAVCPSEHSDAKHEIKGPHGAL